MDRSGTLPAPGRRRGLHLARALLGLATAFAIVTGGLSARAQSGPTEYMIKAAYLFKFTPFVEWPSSAFATASSPFYICILGGDPFGSDLDLATSGHRVGQHPVQIRRLAPLDAADMCHILYLNGSRAPAVRTALDKVRGAPILTVTEQSLGVSGGVVQFVVKDGRVRFTIDAGVAATNRVVISAKLLSLAASVQPGP